MSVQLWVKTAGFAVLTFSAAVFVNWIMKRSNQGKKKVYITMKKKSIKTKEELQAAKWTHVGKIKKIWIYPVKSCAGISVDSAYTARLGLQSGVIQDRIFMIVNDKGIMITGRAIPKTVLIQPCWVQDKLTLSFPDMESVTVNVKEIVDKADNRTVRVWKDEVPGLDCGDDVAVWLTKVLQRSCRLVYHSNMPSPRSTADVNFPLLLSTDNSYYADLSGYMMMTVESIKDLASRVNISISAERFRPNLLMEGSHAYAEDDWEYVKIGEVTYRNPKACDRCIFTTVDNVTAEKNKDMEPLRTLRSYRCVEGETAPYFGTNLGLDVPGTIHVGDDIYATYPNN